MEAFDKALEPLHADAWRNRGVVLNNLSQYEEAANSCDRAIAIDPFNARAWIVKGFALHNLGKYEGAVLCCARAIELPSPGSRQKGGTGTIEEEHWTISIDTKRP